LERPDRFRHDPDLDRARRSCRHESRGRRQAQRRAGKALADPKAQEQLKTLGVLPNFSTPAEFAARIAADRAVYAEIVAKANLTFR